MMTARLGMETPKDDIRSAFDLFDRDGVGRITMKNLKEVAHELGEKVSEEDLRV